MKHIISLRTIVGLGAVACLCVAIPASSPAFAKGGSAPTGCNTDGVSSTLNAPYQIQSDGLNSYITFSSHKDSVTSGILSDCSWQLDTTDSASRRIAVTLEYPYNDGPSAPFGSGTQFVRGVINSHCSKNVGNGDLDFGNMTSVGQVAICPINIGFYVGATWYNIAINPYNWPNTTQAQVTCGNANGGVCNEWTVVPDPRTDVISPTGQASAIGELVLPSCVGCTTGTPLGLYEVSFSFLIQDPN